MKPVLKGTPPKTQVPVTKGSLDQISWSFSFKHFRQIEYFGLGESHSKWFVSLLEKFAEMSGHDIAEFLKDHKTKKANRFHKIDWDSKNVPIKRRDINWIPDDIIDNEEDYPFLQFQISKGRGRIIGFWEENYRFFNIVLLDPMHNMQPSKDYDYKVDDTTIQLNEFSSLLMDIDSIKGKKCILDGCECKRELHMLQTRLNRGRFVYFQLDDEYYEHFMAETEKKSLKEIIELGLLMC